VPTHHGATPPQWFPAETIASLSFGGPRRFTIRHNATGERWTLELGHGDLLVMSGSSQHDYQHAIPKTRAAVAPRINLTFRLVF